MQSENNRAADSERHFKQMNVLYILMTIGFVVAISGIAILTIASVFSSSSSTSSSAVIFIGPFPIVFGNGPEASWLIVISILLAALSTIIFYFARTNKARKTV
jgi:uncharacterized membrane protein